MRRDLRQILDRVIALIGALFLAQFPSFFAQYIHELSGRVAELNYQIFALEQSAKGAGKTLQELIAKFLKSTDIDIAAQGKFLSDLLSRFAFLNEGYQSLTEASLLMKPFLFVRYFSYTIFKDTASHYQWSLPITIEGFIYAFIGLVLGYLVSKAIPTLSAKES